MIIKKKEIEDGKEGHRNKIRGKIYRLRKGEEAEGIVGCVYVWMKSKSK